jgi:E3 ubiquitin-protein ligase KEG
MGYRNLLARAAVGKTGCSLGALLDSRNEYGQTALHMAVMRGSIEMVNTILDHPEADVDALDKDGNPPILFTLAYGMTECLKALIRRGADVNVRLKEGLGPSISHMCAGYGEPECMQVKCEDPFIFCSISAYLVGQDLLIWTVFAGIAFCRS